MINKRYKNLEINENDTVICPSCKDTLQRVYNNQTL